MQGKVHEFHVYVVGFFQLINTHGTEITPWSYVVGEHLERDSFGHGCSFHEGFYWLSYARQQCRSPFSRCYAVEPDNAMCGFELFRILSECADPHAMRQACPQSSGPQYLKTAIGLLEGRHYIVRDNPQTVLDLRFC